MSLTVNRSPRTVLLNAQIVLVHSYPEKSWLSPVRSPTVSPHPKFYSVLHSPSHDRHLMSKYRWKHHLLINSPLVTNKLLSCGNTAWNRSSCVNLSLHLLRSFNLTVFFHFPNLIPWSCPTISFVIWVWTWRSFAVVTLVNISASCYVWVPGLVRLTTFLWDTVLLCVSVDIHGVSTPTCSTSRMTIDKDLRRQTHVRPGSVSGDVDSVRKRWSCRMSPTAATILREMLISCPRKVICAIDVSPVPCRGESW